MKDTILDSKLTEINKNLLHLRKCKGHKFGLYFDKYGQCSKCGGYHKNLTGLTDGRFVFIGYDRIDDLDGFFYEIPMQLLTPEELNEERRLFHD